MTITAVVDPNVININIIGDVAVWHLKLLLNVPVKFEGVFESDLYDRMSNLLAHLYRTFVEELVLSHSPFS